MSHLLEALRLHKPLPQATAVEPNGYRMTPDEAQRYPIGSLTFERTDFLVTFERTSDGPSIVGVKIGDAWWWAHDVMSWCLLDALNEQLAREIAEEEAVECECCGVRA